MCQGFNFRKTLKKGWLGWHSPALEARGYMGNVKVLQDSRCDQRCTESWAADMWASLLKAWERQPQPRLNSFNELVSMSCFRLPRFSSKATIPASTPSSVLCSKHSPTITWVDLCSNTGLLLFKKHKSEHTMFFQWTVLVSVSTCWQDKVNSTMAPGMAKQSNTIYFPAMKF